MALVDRSSNEQQIVQGVLDVPKQALKVTFAEPVDVEFSGGTQAVEINSLDDSVAIADAITGNSAEVIGRKLQVSGSFTGTTTATIAPSTDFQAKTLTATTTPQQLTFSGLAQVTSISIVAFGSNLDAILIAKTNGAATADSYYLFPGSAINLPVSGGANVWVTANTGSQQFTTVAVN